MRDDDRRKAPGFDASYDAVRAEGGRDLKNAMAGPNPPLQEPAGVKNPDGEFAVPAPMGERRTGKDAGNPGHPGPLSPQGFTPNDPEGQQGATHRGGSADENGHRGPAGTTRGKP